MSLQSAVVDIWASGCGDTDHIYSHFYALPLEYMYYANGLALLRRRDVPVISLELHERGYMSTGV